MPTVIDELIVKLGLDPTDFNQEEAKLAESLRRMEDRAARGARQVQDTVGASTVQFFRTIRSPIAGLERMFEDWARTTEKGGQRTSQTLTAAQRNFNAVTKAAQESGTNLAQVEDQGRRMGEGVEGGALAGARGLRVLGAAGLGVFAAYEALSKTLAAATDGAQRLFGTGIGAASAGMPIQEFTAISQALLRGGNVPLAQTQATLGELKAAQVGYSQAGPAGDAARARLIALNTGLVGLGITGVDVWRDSPEQIMNKLSAAFAGMSDSQFNPANISAQTGIPIEEVYGMRRVGGRSGGLAAATEAERARAPREGQGTEAGKLVEATNNLSNALVHLGHVLGAIVDGPLAKLENALAWLVDKFAEGEDSAPGEDERYKQQTGDAAEQGAWPSWQRFKWNMRNSPVGRMLGLGTGDAAPGSGGSGGGGAQTPDGQVLGTVLGTARSGGLSDAATQGMIAAGLGEGGFSGAWKPGDGGTSHGPWQLHSGGELDHYTREGNAPGDVAAQTRYVMKRMDELHPGWRTSNDPAQVARWMNDFERSSDWVGKGIDNYQQYVGAAGHMMGASSANQRNFTAPSSAPDHLDNEGAGGSSSAQMDYWKYNQAHPGHELSWSQYVAQIQREQAGAGSTSTTHNAGDTHFHGDINVDATGLREGGAIADAVEDRIRRVSIATTANTGLE